MKGFFLRLSAIAFLLIGLFALVQSPQPAYACTATSATNPGPPPRQFTIQEQVDLAPIIIEGTVVDTGPGNFATIEIHRYFKDSGPAMLTGVRFGDGALCQAPLLPGGPMIIFLSEWSPGDYSAYYFNGVATLPATEDTIQQIISSTGQQPFYPNATFTLHPAVPQPGPSGQSDPNDFSGFLELCLASFVPVLMSIVMIRRRVTL